MSAKNLDIAVYVTAALLAVSMFLPLTELPIVGEVSYNRVADIESYIVIAFCIAAVGLLLAGQARYLFAAPAGVWITLLYPAIRNALESDDGGLFSKAMDRATSVLHDFAGEMFLDIADFHWGGFVFLIALLAFTAVCVMRSFK